MDGLHVLSRSDFHNHSTTAYRSDFRLARRDASDENFRCEDAGPFSEPVNGHRKSDLAHHTPSPCLSPLASRFQGVSGLMRSISISSKVGSERKNKKKRKEYTVDDLNSYEKISFMSRSLILLHSKYMTWQTCQPLDPALKEQRFADRFDIQPIYLVAKDLTYTPCN